MNNDTRTENDAVIELAAELAARNALVEIEDHEIEDLRLFAKPDGEIIKVDLNQWRDIPRHMAGTVTAHDLQAVIALVEQYHGAEYSSVVTYANEKALKFTTVINDHNDGTPGRGSTRIEYSLESTPEWAQWKTADRTMMRQEQFAEFIEDRFADIVDPDPADLLEIAQTFHAAGSIEIRSAKRLSSGATQITYNEDIVAKGGTSGQLDIPRTFGVWITPFYGCQPVRATARFRHRLNAGDLTLGFIINDRDRLEREAFDSLLAELDNDCEWLVVRAVAR